jgi:hypothetical protein
VFDGVPQLRLRLRAPGGQWKENILRMPIDEQLERLKIGSSASPLKATCSLPAIWLA